MNDKPESRLSEIQTDWDGVRAAHASQDNSGGVEIAREKILDQYFSCVKKYILGATYDPELAEDLAQEFAVRFVRGDFRNVDPAQGRFRDYLKRSLRNLITDHFRKPAEYKLKTSIAAEVPDRATDANFDTLDAEFQSNWRKQILHNAWESLRSIEQARGNWYYTVLHYRAKNPESRSAEMSLVLSQVVGESVSAEWVRQKIHRARQKFADLLIAEVRGSMQLQDEELVQQELAELGLKKYSSDV